MKTKTTKLFKLIASKAGKVVFDDRIEADTPREWIYAWYMPQGNRNVFEFAFDHRFKLYRDGKFFDLTKDLDEKFPRGVSSLTGDAAKAATALQRRSINSRTRGPWVCGNSDPWSGAAIFSAGRRGSSRGLCGGRLRWCCRG